MVNYDEILQKAKDCGFTAAAKLDISTLEFLPEVREMCAADKCNMYGKSWACPPACGTLDEMAEKVKGYHEGILVQTVGQLEDSLDWEAMQETSEAQAKNFAALEQELVKDYPNLWAMGTGTCTKCKKCTYPDAPCRFPDQVFASMEACGLYVSKVCTDNGLPYNYGPNTLAYTACYLLE